MRRKEQGWALLARVQMGPAQPWRMSGQVPTERHPLASQTPPLEAKQRKEAVTSQDHLWVQRLLEVYVMQKKQMCLGNYFQSMSGLARTGLNNIRQYKASVLLNWFLLQGSLTQRYGGLPRPHCFTFADFVVTQCWSNPEASAQTSGSGYQQQEGCTFPCSQIQLNEWLCRDLPPSLSDSYVTGLSLNEGLW